MKNIALIAGAMALVAPAAAYAGHSAKHKSDDGYYTYKKVDASADDNNYRIEMQDESDFRSNRANRSFAIGDGQKIQLEGDTAYKVDSDGSRFYAPNGSYKTSNNLTIVVNDGQLVRIENPAEVVAFDFNDNNRHR